MNVDRLHERITNAERLEAIGQVPVWEILTAPGHTRLRDPGAITGLAAAIGEGQLERLVREPILLGIFTAEDGSEIGLRSVECLDGHHRLLAGLLAGAWNRVEDLPDGAVDTRVNGWRVDGSAPEDRWIPLDVARRSGLSDDEWALVPEEWGAKGPTARISGDIFSQDVVFVRSDRGVSFGQLARAWRNRNHGADTSTSW